MKTILIITNVLLFGIVLYLLVRKQAIPPSPAKPNASCKDSICKDYSGGAFNGISAELAKTLSQSYANDEGKKYVRRSMGARNVTSIDDATSVWFSLETLKRFIWKIEQSACEHSCTAKPVLGIRIYYAKYPDSTAMMSNTELNTVKPEYAEHHTVFMVPTWQDSGKHIDFDPLYWGKNNCKPLPFKERFLGRTKEDVLSLRDRSMILVPSGFRWVDSDGDGVADLMDPELQNHGDLAPPPRGTGTFGKQ